MRRRLPALTDAVDGMVRAHLSINCVADAAGNRLGMDRGAVLRWVGHRAMPGLKETWPALFEAHGPAHDFTLAVSSMIHPDVRKLHHLKRHSRVPGIKAPVDPSGRA